MKHQTTMSILFGHNPYTLMKMPPKDEIEKTRLIITEFIQDLEERLYLSQDSMMFWKGIIWNEGKNEPHIVMELIIHIPSRYFEKLSPCLFSAWGEKLYEYNTECFIERSREQLLMDVVEKIQPSECVSTW